jgi:hypothetical protein
VIPLPVFAFLYGLSIPESPVWRLQEAGYTALGEKKRPGLGLCRELGTTLQLFQRRDVLTPVLLLVVVMVGQQCSGMKIIQGYAVEIFADVFTEVHSTSELYLTFISCLRK